VTENADPLLGLVRTTLDPHLRIATLFVRTPDLESPDSEISLLLLLDLLQEEDVLVDSVEEEEEVVAIVTTIRKIPPTFTQEVQSREFSLPSFRLCPSTTDRMLEIVVCRSRTPTINVDWVLMETRSRKSCNKPRSEFFLLRSKPRNRLFKYVSICRGSAKRFAQGGFGGGAAAEGSGSSRVFTGNGQSHPPTSSSPNVSRP
jgi:hypothetical protein